MVLVDSSIWIGALRRDGDVITKLGLKGLLDEYEAAWCSVVKGEVMGGAREDERKMLTQRFEVVPYYQVTEKDWDWAVVAAWRLQAKGMVVKLTDLLVAAVATRCALRVYAEDKHFEMMREHLGLRLYKPGYNGMYNDEEG